MTSYCVTTDGVVQSKGEAHTDDEDSETVEERPCSVNHSNNNAQKEEQEQEKNGRRRNVSVVDKQVPQSYEPYTNDGHAPYPGVISLSSLPLLSRVAYLSMADSDNTMAAYNYAHDSFRVFERLIVTLPLNVDEMSDPGRELYTQIRRACSWRQLSYCLFTLRREERSRLNRYFDYCKDRRGIPLEKLNIPCVNECVLLLDHAKHVLYSVFLESPCSSVTFTHHANLSYLDRPLPASCYVLEYIVPDYRHPLWNLNQHRWDTFVKEIKNNMEPDDLTKISCEDCNLF